MNETLDSLISATLQGLSDAGYSNSIITDHRRVYAALAKYCLVNGIISYDEFTGKSFLDDFIAKRYPHPFSF